jgi:hypothetical protein
MLYAKNGAQCVAAPLSPAFDYYSATLVSPNMFAEGVEKVEQ